MGKNSFWKDFLDGFNDEFEYDKSPDERKKLLEEKKQLAHERVQRANEDKRATFESRTASNDVNPSDRMPGDVRENNFMKDFLVGCNDEFEQKFPDGKKRLLAKEKELAQVRERKTHDQNIMMEESERSLDTEKQSNSHYDTPRDKTNSLYSHKDTVSKNIDIDESSFLGDTVSRILYDRSSTGASFYAGLIEDYTIPGLLDDIEKRESSLLYLERMANEARYTEREDYWNGRINSQKTQIQKLEEQLEEARNAAQEMIEKSRIDGQKADAFRESQVNRIPPTLRPITGGILDGIPSMVESVIPFGSALGVMNAIGEARREERNKSTSVEEQRIAGLAGGASATIGNVVSETTKNTGLKLVDLLSEEYKLPAKAIVSGISMGVGNYAQSSLYNFWEDAKDYRPNSTQLLSDDDIVFNPLCTAIQLSTLPHMKKRLAIDLADNLRENYHLTRNGNWSSEKILLAESTVQELYNLILGKDSPEYFIGKENILALLQDMKKDLELYRIAYFR